MSTSLVGIARLESLLAGLLYYGTWLASAVIGLGLTLAVIERSSSPDATTTGMHIVTWGIALFIMLPVVRVVVMLIAFLLERDYRFAAIAALVLIIILLGLALGMYMSPGRTLA